MIDNQLSLLSSAMPSQNSLRTQYNDRFNSIPVSISSLKHPPSTATASTPTTKSILTSSIASRAAPLPPALPFNSLSNQPNNEPSNSPTLNKAQKKSIYGEGESFHNAVERLHQEHHSTFGLSIHQIVDEHVRNFVKKTDFNLFLPVSTTTSSLNSDSTKSDSTEAKISRADFQNSCQLSESSDDPGLRLRPSSSGISPPISFRQPKPLPPLSRPYIFGDLSTGRTLDYYRDGMEGLEGVGTTTRRCLPQLSKLYILGNLAANEAPESIKETRAKLRASIDSSFISTIPILVSGTEPGLGLSAMSDSVHIDPDVDVAVASSPFLHGHTPSPSILPARTQALSDPRPVKEALPSRSPASKSSPSSPLPSPQISPAPSPKRKSNITLDKGRIRFSSTRPREPPKTATVPNPFDQFEDHDIGQPVPRVSTSPVIPGPSLSRQAHAGRWRKVQREDKESYKSRGPVNNWKREGECSKRQDQHRDGVRDSDSDDSHPDHDHERDYHQPQSSRKAKKRRRSYSPEIEQPTNKMTSQRHDLMVSWANPYQAFNPYSSYNPYYSYHSSNSLSFYNSHSSYGAYNYRAGDIQYNQNSGYGPDVGRSESFRTKEETPEKVERSPKRSKTRAPTLPPRPQSPESDFSIASSRASSPLLDRSRILSSEKTKLSTDSSVTRLNTPKESGLQQPSPKSAISSLSASSTRRKGSWSRLSNSLDTLTATCDRSAAEIHEDSLSRGDSPIPGLSFSAYVAIDENELASEAVPCEQQDVSMHDIHKQLDPNGNNDRSGESIQRVKQNLHQHSRLQHQRRNIDMFDGDLSDESSIWSLSSTASSRSNTPISKRARDRRASRDSDTSDTTDTPDTAAIVVPPKLRAKVARKTTLTSSLPLKNPPRSSTLKAVAVSINSIDKTTRPSSKSTISLPLTPPPTATTSSRSPESFNPSISSTGSVSLLLAPTPRSRLPSTSKVVEVSQELSKPTTQSRSRTEKLLFIKTTCRTVLPLVMPEEYRTWLEEQEAERLSAPGIQRLNMIASKMRRNAYLSQGSVGGRLSWDTPFPDRNASGRAQLEKTLDKILKLRPS